MAGRKCQLRGNEIMREMRRIRRYNVFTTKYILVVRVYTPSSLYFFFLFFFASKAKWIKTKKNVSILLQLLFHFMIDRILFFCIFMASIYESTIILIINFFSIVRTIIFFVWTPAICIYTSTCEKHCELMGNYCLCELHVKLCPCVVR